MIQSFVALHLVVVSQKISNATVRATVRDIMKMNRIVPITANQELFGVLVAKNAFLSGKYVMAFRTAQMAEMRKIAHVENAVAEKECCVQSLRYA